MMPSYDDARVRCAKMMADHENRTGPFSSRVYARQTDVFAHFPTEEIFAYLNSPSVRHEFDQETLRLCVKRPPADMHPSPAYQTAIAHVRECLERVGYVRPPFLIDGQKRRPSRKLLAFATDRIAELGGEQIEVHRWNGDTTLTFHGERLSLGAIRGTVDFDSLTGAVKLSAGGGGLQPYGFALNLLHDYSNGMLHCNMCGFRPAPDVVRYLRFDDEQKVANLIDLIFAQLSYF